MAPAAIIGKRIRQRRKSRCIVIAGPNGAGKTTFALRWLPGQRIDEFVNADLIAKGISPLDPSRAAIAAGRLLVEKLDQLAVQGTSFAFESTLSGLAYARRLRQFKALGYRMEVIFLALPSSAVALQRVQSRVAQGGTTCRARTLFGGSSGASRTSGLCTPRSLIPGPCMIIRAQIPYSLRADHESSRRIQDQEKADVSARQVGRSRVAKIRRGRPARGADARDAHLGR